MAIRNFLCLGTHEPLLLADVVFWIADFDKDRPVLKPLLHQGHAGLVATAKPEGHSLGEDVVVYHMTPRRVEKHRWADGKSSDFSRDPHRVTVRVDVAGTVTELDENGRDDVIRVAAGFYARIPSKLSSPPGDTCYWLGDPNPSAHPQHPGAEGAYAFSCATFVHHCNSEADLDLIDLEDIPEAPLDGSDRQWFERNRFPVQKDPIRRLRCGNLIGAFEAEQFPFQPNTWDDYLDEVVFARVFADFPGGVVPYPAPEDSDPLSLRDVLEDVVDVLEPESAP